MSSSLKVNHLKKVERQIDGVNFILIRQDKKILIQQRSADAPKCPNMFCFPGGAKDIGETDEQAVLREIREETFLTISPKLLRYSFDFEYFSQGRLKVNRFFVCFIHQTEVVSGEGQMYWLTFQEVSSLELALGENEILPKLKEILE